MRKVTYIDKVFDSSTKFQLVYGNPLISNINTFSEKYCYRNSFYLARIEHKRAKLRDTKRIAICLKQKLSLTTVMNL